MDMMITLCLVVTLTWLVYPSHGKIQDLTWVLDMDHISVHPLLDDPIYRFTYHVLHKGPLKDSKFVSLNSYSTVEHMGTHIDAPYHFDEHGKHIDEIPLEDLYGPLVRINIAARAAEDRNAAVTVQDLLNWEKEHGEIPDRAFVLMYSGWDKYWGDSLLYTGTNNTEDPGSMPSFSGEAATWLLSNRNILGIGVDSLSCDTGESFSWPVHNSILPAGKLCVENLRKLDKVPASGATLVALPIMLKGGTGAQARVFAQWGSNVVIGTGYGVMAWPKLVLGALVAVLAVVSI